MIFEVVGALVSVGAGVFMHLLVKEMSKKYYLRWPDEAGAIVGLYLIGVLPCVILTGLFINQIISN